MADNKLLSFIIDDGRLRAEGIIREAENKSDEILRDAAEKAAQSAKEIELAAEKKGVNLKNIASSNASLVSRNTVLSAKREQLDKTVEGMKQYILSLDSDRYFELLYRMARGISVGSGEFLLCKKDLERLPSDFTDRMAESGITASVCDKSADISGGFILRSGPIEMNCSIDSVVDDKRNEIEDFINESIFEE